MSDTRPYPLDLTDGNTRRFPRLAVRNRSPVVISESGQSSEESNNEAPSSSGDGRTGGSHSRQSSYQSLRPEYRHSRQSSKATNITEQQFGRQAGKKKSAGVLGFLTLKEPSTSALEEFAEQERRKAAQKNLKSNGVILPGVSSQKLPAHVPKVNSKWDGLPDSTKVKLDKDREREKAKRSSVTSFASNGSGDTARRSYGSLSSKPAARRSQDRPDTGNSRSSAAPSSTTQPALRHTQGQLSDDVQAQTVLHPPTPPTMFRLDSQDNTFEFDLSDVPNLQEREYSSGSGTSPEASPRTPAFDAVYPALDYSKRSQSPALLSTSPLGNGLSPPTVLSAKGSGRSLTTQAGTSMPPIQEAAAPRAVSNFSRPTRVTAAPSVALSRSDSAIARKVSPAAAVKGSQKNEVLPWEMFEPPSESSISTKGAPETSKLKRFSKLGRK